MDHTVQERSANSLIQSKYLLKDEDEDHGNEHALFIEVFTFALQTGSTSGKFNFACNDLSFNTWSMSQLSNVRCTQ